MQHECVLSGCLVFFWVFLQSLKQELLSFIISYSYGEVLMFLFRTQELDLRINFKNVMTCSYQQCKVVQKHGT